MEKRKNKYDTLNYLNEKYDVIGTEITCYEDIDDFWRDFNNLYMMNKVSEEDMQLGMVAVGIN